MENIDKLDTQILYCLYRENKNTKIQSFRIKDILNSEEDDIKFSYYTYVNRIKKLKELNLVGDGFKEGNANCYYITEEGTKFLENNVLNHENIYIEEEDK